MSAYQKCIEACNTVTANLSTSCNLLTLISALQVNTDLVTKLLCPTAAAIASSLAAHCLRGAEAVRDMLEVKPQSENLSR